MTSPVSYEHPFQNFVRVPHGAGLAMHLIGLCWAMRLYCVAAALLRSPYTSLARTSDGRVCFNIIAATGFDRRVIINNAEALSNALSDRTWYPVTFDAFLPEDVEGALGEELLKATDYVHEVLPLKPSGAAPTPTFDVLPEAIVYGTSRGTRGPFDPCVLLENAPLAISEDYRDRGLCECAVCTGPEQVWVVSTSDDARDGFSLSAMGSDLMHTRELPNPEPLPTSTGNLISLAHWIDKALPKRLPATPGTLAIARGGGFDRASLDEFVRIAGTRLSALGAEGWDVHIALGHTRAVVSIPHVTNHRSPSTMDEHLAGRLAKTQPALLLEIP